MDDLMAGLDASVFDHFEVSPVKVKPVARAVRSPLKILKSVTSSTRQCRPDVGVERPLPHPTPPSVQIQPRKLLDVEIRKPQDRDLASVKQDPTLEVGNEELFDFEFDLADLSAFDEELLLKPDNIKVRVFVSDLGKVNPSDSLSFTSSSNPRPSRTISIDTMGPMRGGCSI